MFYIYTSIFKYRRVWLVFMGFLQIPKLRLIGESKYPVGGNVSVNGCLSLCLHPVIHWRLVLGGTSRSMSAGIGSNHQVDGWMVGWLVGWLVNWSVGGSVGPSGAQAGVWWMDGWMDGWFVGLLVWELRQALVGCLDGWMDEVGFKSWKVSPSELHQHLLTLFHLDSDLFLRKYTI